MFLGEFRLKINLSRDVYLSESYAYVGKMVAKTIFHENSKIKEEHYKHKFKPYVFSNLGYVKNKTYKKNKDYFFTLRTVDEKIAEYILNNYQDDFGKIEIVEKCNLTLEQIPSVKIAITENPVILIKKDKSYVTFPKDNIKTAVELINVNTVKKMKQFYNEEFPKDFDFIDSIRIVNKKHPITIKYKKVKLLGYKYHIIPKEDELSQKAVKLLYGIGMGSKNASIGAGFLSIGV